MPPLLQSFLASVARHSLSGAAVYFVTHGYFPQSDAENYVAGFTLAVIALGWSFYQKYASAAALDLEQAVTAYLKRSPVASSATPSGAAQSTK